MARSTLTVIQGEDHDAIVVECEEQHVGEPSENRLADSHFNDREAPGVKLNPVQDGIQRKQKQMAEPVPLFLVPGEGFSNLGLGLLTNLDCDHGLTPRVRPEVHPTSCTDAD